MNIQICIDIRPYQNKLKAKQPKKTRNFFCSLIVSQISTKKVEDEPQAARVAENSPGGSTPVS